METISIISLGSYGTFELPDPRIEVVYIDDLFDDLWLD